MFARVWIQLILDSKSKDSSSFSFFAKVLVCKLLSFVFRKTFRNKARFTIEIKKIGSVTEKFKEKKSIRSQDSETQKSSYPSKEQKSEFVKTNFDKIAKSYDAFNDLNSFFLHRIWKKELVKELLKEVPNPKTVLDLCTGTGDIALRLSKISGLESLQYIDFSPEMLQIAKTRFASVNQHIQSIAIPKIGDAMNLKEISANSLDAVSIGFGLRNVTEIETTLKEVLRVLKPGGVFLNLDVGKVEGFLKPFADFYFFKIVPKLGYLLFRRKEYMFEYLPESSLHFPSQKELKRILESLGFANVRFRNFVFGNVALHIARKQ